MTDNDKSCLYDGEEIILYEKKVSQSFKRPAVLKKLLEFKCDETKLKKHFLTAGFYTWTKLKQMLNQKIDVIHAFFYLR
jgi:hypothetical protein